MYRRRYRWQVAGRVVRTTGPAAVIGWVAGLILMSLSACSGAVDPSTEPGPATFQTHPTSPASVLPETTSSSRPTEPYTEAAAEAAFREAYAAHVDYLVDRSQIEGAQARFKREAARALWDFGEELEARRVTVEVPMGSLVPEVVSVSLDRPGEAAIVFCVYDATIQRDPSGRVLDDQAGSRVSEAGMALEDGWWIVESMHRVEDWPGIDGCKVDDASG